MIMVGEASAYYLGSRQEEIPRCAFMSFPRGVQFVSVLVDRNKDATLALDTTGVNLMLKTI